MSLFDEMLQSKHYQELLSKLPDDERIVVLASLREFVDTFEKHVLKPLENTKPK